VILRMRLMYNECVMLKGKDGSYVLYRRE